MNVVQIPRKYLRSAPWSPNIMGATERAKLTTSVATYGVVENMVVRPTDDSHYEVLSGNL